MGFFLALISLVIIVVTGTLGVLYAFRKDPVWKDWLLGSLAGFIIFFISLFIIPVPVENPQQTVENPRQAIENPQQAVENPQQTIVNVQPRTTTSAVYNETNNGYQSQYQQ
jgi:hypothetical protein